MRRCNRRLAVGAKQHGAPAQSVKVLVGDCLQSAESQPFHLGGVVHDVAQTCQPSGTFQFRLGLVYGGHHSEAEP